MEKIDYVEIGKRIRVVRKAQGMTQEEASERCDITSSYYGNIERGNKKMSVETLAKITKGLGVTADELLFGDHAHKDRALKELLREVRRSADDKQFDKYLNIIKTLATIIDQL